MKYRPNNIAWFALFLFAVAIIISAMSSCQPVTAPTCDTVRIRVTDTVVVHVPAKLEYVVNKNRRFGSALEYWLIRTDSLDLLFTGVEIYNGRKRANENPEDLPVGMTTDEPIAKPIRLTGGALPAVTGVHTLRSDCLTCHKN